jgi:hypothetical protein
VARERLSMRKILQFDSRGKGPIRDVILWVIFPCKMPVSGVEATVGMSLPLPKAMSTALR